MTRIPLLTAAAALVLSACASAPALRPADTTPRLGHDLAVDVVLDGQRVGGGQGTWLEPGVVLTTLDAVNDVPPTGELIVRAGDGTRLSASVWTGGNPVDANAAYLFVHHPDRFGALARLPAQSLCASAPQVLLATHPGDSTPEPLALSRYPASQPELTGSIVRGPDGCIAGLVTVRQDEATLVPLEALQLVARSLPRPEAP
jgi:hypothetical protein